MENRIEYSISNYEIELEVNIAVKIEAQLFVCLSQKIDTKNAIYFT